MEIITKELNKIKNLKCILSPVKSKYWGEHITVAGLITSDDLIDTVKDIKADIVVIPSVMLKPFTQTFLDGNTLDYVKEKTKKQFFTITEQYSIKELTDFLLSLSI